MPRVGGKPLVTFYGWDGKWWRRIKVGRAVWSAAQWTIIPFKWQLAILAGELTIGQLKKLRG